MSAAPGSGRMPLWKSHSLLNSKKRSKVLPPRTARLPRISQVRLIIDDAGTRVEDYGRRFRGQVREGLTAAGRGEFVEHEDVGRMLHERYHNWCVSRAKR